MSNIVKLKKSSFILVFVLVLIFVSACSNNESTSKDSNGKNLKLEYWTNSGSESEQIVEVMKDWNKQNPDTQVKVTMIPGSPTDYYQKLSTAFAAGKGPDIFAISPAELVKYVDSDLAYPVNEWIDPNKDDYFENTLAPITFEDKIYAFPSNMGMLALFYNKKLLEEKGLQPPKTWNELLEVAKKLTTKDRYGLLIETNEGAYQNYEFYPFVWMNDGDILSQDGKKVTVKDNDAVRKSLKLYRDLMKSGVVSKKLETGGYDIEYLAKGNTAMMLSVSPGVQTLNTKYPDFEYGVVPYPVPEEGMEISSAAGGWRMMISSKGQDPKRSGDVIDWMTNQDTEQPISIVKKSNRFSPRKSVIEDAGEFYEEYPMDLFANEILPIAKMEPSYPAEVVKAVGEAIQQAMFTDTSLDQIIEDLEKKSKAAIEKK